MAVLFMRGTFFAEELGSDLQRRIGATGGDPGAAGPDEGTSDG